MSINLMEKIRANVAAFGDRPVLADDMNPKGITLNQLEQISGKVYSYLKGKGIGKEDFVMLCLPRGIQPIIGMVGVWKCGAAFVVVEDTYAPERIEFIKNDCGCKIVINAQTWEEIQHCEYREGYEPTDEHDAAFAVYTSGTTGNPKGVLHEYGNIPRMIESITMQSCAPLANSEDRFALVAPLNFVASQLIILYGLYYGVFNYVVSYSIVKNPLAIGMFIIKNKITGTFLTPSYIRKMTKKPPMLKFCIIGSEPANGVFLDDLVIHNFYLMSESGFAVTHFLIDQRYEITPVGKSEFGHEILLLDENGNPVPDGEKGEVCFENKFVRGYMNLPEETARVFKDGYYHTGDLAFKDENGNFAICGRLGDMVKINGNRVEPGEIEEVTKKVLGIDFAAAKIFDEGGRVFICVYYTANIQVDFEKTRKKMEEYLPYYMLPSYFIHIDSVPLRPNGKMDRKALPAPEIDAYKNDYVAPENDTEKALCLAFEKVLKVTKVGVDDDFYQLGGDSMTSMDVLVESKLPGLTTTEIFRAHTPRKIAAMYLENHVGSDGISDEEKNAEAIKKPHALTAEQTYMVDYQFYTPDSTMYNLFNMIKLDREMLDMEGLAEAVKKAALAHPALLTKFSFNEDGEMIQQYCPEFLPDIEVERVTEAELEEIKKSLVAPFRIFNSCLFRCRLFETEEAGYLFLDVHHTVFDGTSSKVFFGDVLKAYAGQDLQVDKYYYVLAKREELAQNEFYNESREYYEKKYDGIKWHTRPKTDEQTRENTDEELFVPIVTPLEKIEDVESKYGLTPNAFFIASALLATALYNRKDRTMVSWIYNGRSDISELSSVGLLFRNLPVGIVLKQNMTLKELYEEVLLQVNKGIEHSVYPYVELNSLAVTGDLECVLYQDNLRSLDEIPGLLGEVEIPHNKAASQNVLDLEILNDPEGLMLMMDYASARYEESSMQRFGKMLNAVAATLIEVNNVGDIPLKKIFKKVNRKIGEGGLFSKKRKMDWMK